jgi:radical SAM enzyme (rSAM/lipoprotein system)
MTVNHLTLRKKIALKLFRRYKENETKLHNLNYILWECTLRCNLNCIHCGSDCKKDSSVKDMPYEDFFGALDQVRPFIDPNKTMIVLTGGEALLRKDLEIIGDKLYEKGFPWGLVTNGMLLDEKRLTSLIHAGLRSVTVSFDGLMESHNWLRGNAKSFEKAFNAIQLLTKTQGLKYDVVTCVNRKNFGDLHKIKELLINTGLKDWRIFTIFPVGRASEEKELQLPPVEFFKLFEFIKSTRQEKKIGLNYGCEGFLGSYEGDVRNNFFFCRAGINVASVLADGSISACPSLRANFIQGNIYKDNFADVWQNRFNIYRDKSWTKKGTCGDCPSYRYCEGNGMHLRNEETGELLFCHLKRLEEGEKYIV